MRRKKMHWTDDYPVILVNENDYAIMEVELYEGRIVIQPFTPLLLLVRQN